MSSFLHSFFSEASAKGAKSTALQSLHWVIGMLLTSIPIMAWVDAPSWILIAISSAFGLVLVTFIGAYIFLLIKNPDALRSESYTLSKMAIERGLIGDSLSGLREEEVLEDTINEPKTLASGEENTS
ncbi:MAG: hypothetical protein OXU23_17950 [Candidatus Poribacteria bacterium]|nr:hypothetical protein [Candidatus Poribacteria bacterium]